MAKGVEDSARPRHGEAPAPPKFSEAPSSTAVTAKASVAAIRAGKKQSIAAADDFSAVFASVMQPITAGDGKERAPLDRAAREPRPKRPREAEAPAQGDGESMKLLPCLYHILLVPISPPLFFYFYALRDSSDRAKQDRARGARYFC